MAWRGVKSIAEIRKAKPSKYGNSKENGFDSLREMKRYNELLLLEKAGLIKDLKRQVRYEVIPACEKDGHKERAVVYIADFVYHDLQTTVVEDAKGVRTPEYVIKRKLMLWRHGIVIQEV